MKKINYLYLWLSILLIPLASNAQNTQPIINSTLNGRIIDQKTKEPIIGASVQIKGTTHGVFTDVEGKFYFQTGRNFLIPSSLVLLATNLKKPLPKAMLLRLA